MDVTVTAAVLASAVLHAVWSALAYRFDDQVAGFAVLFWVTFLIATPLVLFTPAPDPASWPFLAGSVMAHIGYTLALIRANALAEFGQVYPISRGLAPVLVTAAAVTGLAGPQDRLTIADIGALTVVVSGLILNATTGLGRRRIAGGPTSAVPAAALIAFLIATYTVLDAFGVRRVAEPFSYIAWLAMTQGLFSAAVLTLRPGVTQRLLRPNGLWSLGALGGVLSVTAYSTTIWAQARGSLALVAALRETSIIFATLISVLIFGERAGKRRLIAAGLIVTGIVLLHQ